MRVEQALEAGLNLGRDALEGVTVGLVSTTRDAALAIAQRDASQAPAVLAKLKQVTGAQATTLLQVSGNRIDVLATTQAGRNARIACRSGHEARKSGAFSVIEADATGSPVLRAMVLLPSASAQQPSNRFLEAVVPVPSSWPQVLKRFSRSIAISRLELARDGLTRLYAITLTLTLLLALAAYFRQRLFWRVDSMRR